MSKTRNKTYRAFTLIEILLAILFVSIGFFGYVALHSRLLYSGQKLEQKETVRAATDFIEAVDFTRALLGTQDSIDKVDFRKDVLVPNLVYISTDPQQRDMSWLSNYPDILPEGAKQALPLRVTVYQKPFIQRWNQR